MNFANFLCEITKDTTQKLSSFSMGLVAPELYIYRKLKTGNGISRSINWRCQFFKKTLGNYRRNDYFYRLSTNFHDAPSVTKEKTKCKN